MNNNYWVLNGSGSLPNEMTHDTSKKVDHKRGHQWFLDNAENGVVFNNKKQAIESVKETSVMDNSLWRDISSSQSVRGLNISNKNGSITVSDMVNMEKNGYGNQIGHGSSISLTMSNPVVDPLCLNTGPTFHRIGNIIFPGSTYNTASDANAISVGPDFSKMDKDFISVGQTSSGNFTLRNQFYNGMGNNMLSIGQTFNKWNYNTNSKVPEDFFPVDPFYNKESSSVLVMGENYNKGQQGTISFGGFKENNQDNDPAGGVVSANVVLATTSKTDGAQKAEAKTKKGACNNFPMNVKSLLSTGILDGVPVKYVSWSREKNLRGVVKGTGYLCSCEDCKLNKVINAYEFERHAGCKTKHPNNHIYFENGKTIYAVVQELKSTPQETLFEVMQNVTGSLVNQKNFETWKASYKAATRELHRIYGQDELIVKS